MSYAKYRMEHDDALELCYHASKQVIVKRDESYAASSTKYYHLAIHSSDVRSDPQKPDGSFLK